jgi:2-keto-4-pentenoate hydratase/2-oxohepta-3-ene-1,7-dioic acid hydratase in catechol pathway
MRARHDPKLGLAEARAVAGKARPRSRGQTARKACAMIRLVTRLNGAEMQRATTDLMIHSIPR